MQKLKIFLNFTLLFHVATVLIFRRVYLRYATINAFSSYNSYIYVVFLKQTAILSCADKKFVFAVSEVRVSIPMRCEFDGNLS